MSDMLAEVASDSFNKSVKQSLDTRWSARKIHVTIYIDTTPPTIGERMVNTCATETICTHEHLY
jgi:hypothetical protein